MGRPLEPTCDVCGTVKSYERGLGLSCPNANCGGTATPESLVDDTPPADGKFVKLSTASVKVVLEEKLREQPMLSKVQALDLFGVASDGAQRRITHLMVQVRYPEINRRPGPKRKTRGGLMHPNGVTIGLATRDGVDIR